MPNIIASKWPKWDRFDWREVYRWYWYDCDAWTRFCSDITETLWPKLAQIWLRRSKFVWSLSLSMSKSQLYRIEKPEQFFLASQSYLCKFGSMFLSHISVNDKLSVSIISLQTLVQVSQLYQNRRYISRLTQFNDEVHGVSAQNYWAAGNPNFRTWPLFSNTELWA